MSKADEINLVEAISLLKEMQDNTLIACRCYKTGGVLYRDEKAEKKANAIETVLNYIDNSISKEVIEEKIEELQKEYEEILSDYGNIDTDIMFNITNENVRKYLDKIVDKIIILQELLEGK